jgi:hypothetical protein
MKSFKSFIAERKQPPWIRTLVPLLVLKIHKISKEIAKSTDPVEQNRLISDQLRIQTYIDAIGIGVGLDDSGFLNRIRNMAR